MDVSREIISSDSHLSSMRNRRGQGGVAVERSQGIWATFWQKRSAGHRPTGKVEEMEMKKKSADINSLLRISDKQVLFDNYE